MNEQEARQRIGTLKSNIEKAALGRDALVEDLLLAYWSKGHLLIEDYSGSGISMIMHAFGTSIQEDSKGGSPAYKRVVCKPDFSILQFHEALGLEPRSDLKQYRLPRVLFIEDINVASDKLLSGLCDAMNDQPMVDGSVKYSVDGGRLTVIATQKVSVESDWRQLSRQYAKQFILRHVVDRIPAAKEKEFLRDYSLMNEYSRPASLIPPKEAGEVIACIEAAAKVGGGILDGLLTLMEILQSDSDVDSKSRISTRSLSQFLRLAKTNAFLSGKRDEVKWAEDIEPLLVKGLGHKIPLRRGSAVEAEALLLSVMDKFHEEDVVKKWPKTKHIGGDIDLARAAEIYLAFETHLNSKLWGRDDDATPGTIQLILNAFFADGHILFEDFPGSGKSYMAASLAEMIKDDMHEEIIDIETYHRIQCTPDLMPSDVVGFTSLDGGRMEFKRGPVFAYFVLVDEINRTTPKVQSAFLEAMAEKTVSVDGRTYKLSELFFVIATQNPLDRVGTFELPAAQLDRFLFKRRLEPIRERYEARVMLDEALKYDVVQNETLKSNLWGSVRTAFPGDTQPADDRFVRTGIKPPKVGVREIIAAKKAMLKGVTIHDELIPKMLAVANSIRDHYEKKTAGRKAEGEFRRGSRPSVRSMQKFINAVKVRAFIDCKPGDRPKGQIIARPRHFRELACDLLRHRVVPTDPSLANDPEALDRAIAAIVGEVIKE